MLTNVNVVVAIVAGIINSLVGLLNLSAHSRLGALIYVLSGLVLAVSIFILTKFSKRRRTLIFNEINKYYGATLCEFKEVYMNALNAHKGDAFSIDQFLNESDRNFSLLLQELCRILRTISGQDIQACIKLFKPGDLQTLTLFCRSKQLIKNRETYEGSPILLKDNSLLELAMKNPAKCAYVADIVLLKQELESQGETFKHTNKHWDKLYKSTVIVPILRYNTRKDHLDSNSSNNTKSQVIGFLCIDSLSTIAFSKKNKELIKNIMFFTSNALYMLLTQCTHYTSKYATETENTEV